VTGILSQLRNTQVNGLALVLGKTTNKERTMSNHMSKATATLSTRSNGVQVLDLSIDGTHYGDYPISSGHNALEQAKMMLNDAKDYGCPCVELVLE
jgi:hypothetical protein